ncbi:DUF29 domain-containing protein [Geminocystis sp. GBBB08]|uniref:DUF29 domain-containing protein n=1 Tax=Geminocystis sp. GBBB08 TaxID=2604140 RepID=UPI0027E341EF|nr:DUF29 domain-containing protein [Geminocystis sp. GBBB08]MBL1210667.1 DUF29 domain-containing protein [Geminocystis sp. GBBB08]
MIISNELKLLQELYEKDDHLWLEKTIELLKQKRFNDLDLENLIEELESLSRRDKSTVRSLTEQIIRHLLLLQYWPKENVRNANHWRAEIISFRSQIEADLTTNLSNYLENELSKIYQSALKYVQEKTNYSVNFPQTCPYSLNQILEQNYF